MEDGDEEIYDNLMKRILDGTMEPTCLPFQILSRITENFSERRKIGEGGFGEVYKGVLHNQIFAVKRIKMNSVTVDDGIFDSELKNLLYTTKHPNVVRFLGYCYKSIHEGIKGIGPEKFQLSQTREILLCFEYISNGSLDKHITDELRGLEWNRRFQIIKGICQGLQYLHEERRIIHMDLNPRNIMVDDYMVPKITDSGFAKLAEKPHTTGQPFVTRGYFAPEYERGGTTSVKCVIYSLGVIIVELVTGLKDIPDKINVLRRWKWSYKWNVSARQVPLQAEQVTKCIEIGEWCMQEEPKNRPHSISEIICNLNEIESTRGDIFAVDLIKTSDDDMLGIKPLELRFGFQTNKQIPSEVEVMLTNETGNCVAFYIEAGLPLKCSKRKGIVQGSIGTCVVIITLEAQKATTLSSMPDKVIVKSTKVKEGLTDKDVTKHMFDHEAPNVVDEVNLTVVYDQPEKPQAKANNVPVSKGDNITSGSSKDQRLNFHPPHKTSLPYTYRQPGNTLLVGIDRTKNALVKRLMCGDDGVYTKQLKIMSIFGGGGLGKTALARVVFDHLAATYILKAFVTVGRNRDIKWVLEEILLRLNKVMYSDIHTRSWDEEMLIKEIRDDVLQNERYLIIIDDIWDKQSWDRIKVAFIDHNCGSKVITTSRSYEVAEHSGEVCKLEPLPDHHSKELLYARLQYGRNNICNLNEMEEQCTTEILKKCGGVPLAIITMASLLVHKPKEDWPEVYKSIGFGDRENGDVDDVMKILKFSYYDLPRHLKTCLLYVSTFSEVHEIEKNTLVWRWVAERFVHEEKGKTLFMVGESYFNQLIDRSLLQPAEGTSYTINLCHVHDMVLDMICSVAKEEKFVSTMLDSIKQHPPSSESIVRRLCVQNKTVMQQDLAQTCIPEKLRSFNASGCCFLFDLMSLLPRFQFLRLISMDDCLLTDEYDVQNIMGCHHLRYLGLSRTNIGKLPTELGQLRYLQTLDLRGTELKALPKSVTLLRQLKCLRSEGTEMALPDGMKDLTSLEELRLDKVVGSPNFVKELGKLTNLRILHIGTYMFDDSLNEALVESLSSLKKIEELELCDGGRCKLPTWHNFSPPPELRHLRLHNISYSNGLPEWIKPSFIPHLCHLNVYVNSAQEQDLVNLGNFKELASLCLFITRDRIAPHALAPGAFPKLQYYFMFSPLVFLPGAAPYLQTAAFHVDARAFRDLKPKLDSLVNLPSLVRVHVTILCWDVTVQVVMAAEEAVRQAIRRHDKPPILVLQRSGSCVDYKLKSNTDIIRVILSKLNVIHPPEEDKLEEELDPMDPEVISPKFQAPSVTESLLDEIIDDELPSMLESVLIEMLAECRQREGGASSSRQVISHNSNSEGPVAAMIKSTIKGIKSIINVVVYGDASNSGLIDSSDIEVLIESSYLKAQLILAIKTRIEKMCGKWVAMESNSEQINSTDQQISGSSSNIGEVLTKTLFDCQMYEGRQGGAEESNFEQIDSITQEVISHNLNFNDEPTLDEILDQGLPHMVESVLDEILDKHRQREAGASGSQKVISRNSNFEPPLPSMIKSIINEVLDEDGQGDPEVISHDPDLKSALTSVIKSRIDNWAQGEVNASDSERIDTTDQEINSGSSSNTRAVRMKTLLISQMYEGKQGGVEESNSKHTNSRGPEVISHNLSFNDEPTLDEILDQGLPHMVDSVLDEILDKHRRREAGASGSQKVISRNSNFEPPLPSMIKSIINEVLDEDGQEDPEVISHDPDLKSALTSVIKSRIDNWAQGEVNASDSERIDTTDQEINSGSSSNTRAVRMKTLLISQMYEGKQGGVEESNSKHTNSRGPEVISHNLSFNDEPTLDEILDQGLPHMVDSVLDEILDKHRRREAGASGSQKVISRNSNFEPPLPSMIKSIINEVLDEDRQGDPEVISHDPDLKSALTSVIKSRIDNWAQGEVKASDSERIDTTDQEINSGSISNTRAVRMKTLLISQMFEGKQGEVEESNSKHTNSKRPEVITHNSNSNAGLLSVLKSIVDELKLEDMVTCSDLKLVNSSTISILGKFVFVFEMLERRKREAAEADFEQIDSVDLELRLKQLQSQEERPAEVHQQRFRFPAVFPKGKSSQLSDMTNMLFKGISSLEKLNRIRNKYGNTYGFQKIRRSGHRTAENYEQ